MRIKPVVSFTTQSRKRACPKNHAARKNTAHSRPTEKNYLCVQNSMIATPFKKSIPYLLSGGISLLLVLAVNPFMMVVWQKMGVLPELPAQFMHANDVKVALPLCLDGLLMMFAGVVFLSKRSWSNHFKGSVLVSLIVFLLLLGVQFSTNVILPGKFRLFRLGLMLVELFFLAHVLYLVAVKPPGGVQPRAWVRNLAVAGFGLFLVLGLLEGVFMFVSDTHRFNGTLASRAWFMHNWHLNSEGYRDVEHKPEEVKGKKKVVVLGDSFVAGHGVKNPSDRFSDRLGAMLGDDYVVFNLGVGGSDLRDGYDRLKGFAYKPDILLYSYYPNDIEQDGERGGLILQHAKSYDDIPGWLRYIVRRSYFMNYLYWRLPHPNELTDYKGYVKQCYGSPVILDEHLRTVDSLKVYAEKTGSKFGAVVFPFIEDAAHSAFATEPVLDRLRKLDVPALDVRPWLVDKPVLDYLVNQNDPHPNERLHGMVADSLHGMIKRNGWAK